MNRKSLKKLSAVNKGYLAGMLDADGCVGVARSLSRSGVYKYDFRIRVIITNTNYDLICWLKEITGVGHSHFTSYKYKPTWSSVHRFQVTNSPARELLTEILPYLIVKKERAEMALKLSFGGRQNKNRGVEEYKRQESLYWKLKEMNNRNLSKEDFKTI